MGSFQEETLKIIMLEVDTYYDQVVYQGWKGAKHPKYETYNLDISAYVIM